MTIYAYKFMFIFIVFLVFITISLFIIFDFFAKLNFTEEEIPKRSILVYKNYWRYDYDD